jgi:multidrug efflux system outer membrane protein
MMKGRNEKGEKEKGRKANGYTSYIEALNAERSLFNAGLSFARIRGDFTYALVKFSKAMGGGLDFKSRSVNWSQDVRI